MKKLPLWMTTVKPISKAIALVLFVTLPIFGFYLGTQMPKNTIDNNSQIIKTVVTQTTSPVISTSVVSTKTTTNMAKIEIGLSYPSESIPDVNVCAVNTTNKDLFYCSNKKIENNKFKNNVEIVLNVPNGTYYIQGNVVNTTGITSYYTNYSADCLSKTCDDSKQEYYRNNPQVVKKLQVSVKENDNISIDSALDWYNQLN